MPIVDSHLHTLDSWYEQIETVLDQMERNGVEHTCLVQSLGQLDNSYFFECVRRYPGKFAPVVIVNVDSPDACDELRRLADQGASGVRLRPFHRSPGDDPLAIWRTANELKLSVSCGGTAVQRLGEDFPRLIETFPNLPIVMEHICATNTPETHTAAEWEAIPQALALSRYPNVYVKIHGLGEFSKRAMPPRSPFPFEEPVPPLLDWAYEAFGARRMMWGSDFPPCATREGYRLSLQLTMERFASKSQEERDLIFGGVALSLFPMRS